MAAPLDAIAGVANASAPLPNLVTGGQPAASHLENLKDAGVEVILDIRDPMEPRPVDEPAAVAALGMEYLNIPVTAATMDDATMEKLLGVIRANAGRPMLFHCASGNRVGGPLIAHLMLDHGASEEAAIQAALRGGLRGAEVLEWGLDFVKRKRG
jgi:protein tyrosine phosphatase (PTP) superfamily phosphohydrolase (DUF442 family)